MGRCPCRGLSRRGGGYGNDLHSGIHPYLTKQLRRILCLRPVSSISCTLVPRHEELKRFRCRRKLPWVHPRYIAARLAIQSLPSSRLYVSKFVIRKIHKSKKTQVEFIGDVFKFAQSGPSASRLSLHTPPGSDRLRASLLASNFASSLPWPSAHAR